MKIVRLGNIWWATKELPKPTPKGERKQRKPEESDFAERLEREERRLQDESVGI